jgi:hypothetical protein
MCFHPETGDLVALIKMYEHSGAPIGDPDFD